MFFYVGVFFLLVGVDSTLDFQLFNVRVRKGGTVNRSHCVSDLVRENGSPFGERPFICHKEKRGTCLAEVRVVYAGAFYPRCNEKREPAKRAGRGGAVVILQGPLMTCDLGRRVSRRPSVEGLCFISCGHYSGDSEDTSWGTAPITS
jgi:hypothetical protein